MAKDCTKEIEQLKPAISKFWYIMLGFFVVIVVLIQLLLYVRVTGNLRLWVSLIWAPNIFSCAEAGR